MSVDPIVRHRHRVTTSRSGHPTARAAVDLYTSDPVGTLERPLRILATSRFPDVGVLEARWR